MTFDTPAMWKGLRGLFMKATKSPSARPRRQETVGLAVESLEGRLLMAADAYTHGKNLYVIGTNASDTALVDYVGTSVRVVLNGSHEYFNRNGVESIRFYGYAGNDYYRNNTTLSSYAYGGSGNDVLLGGSNVDYMLGQGGSDAIYGRGGDDVLYGGSGNDWLYGGHGNDWVIGEDGHDVVAGQGGNDTLLGGHGNDRMYGGAGNDRMWASYGNDAMWGGKGHDQLYGQAGHDSMDGGAGNDYLSGSYGNDLMRGGSGNDRMFGGTGNDSLYGGAGVDHLYGESGDDGLFGGAGGRDLLTGGSGEDRFLVNSTVVRKKYYASVWDQWRGHRSYRHVVSVEDVVTDRTSGDSVTHFRNLGQTTVPLRGFGSVTFAAGRWSDADIEKVDVALRNLHTLTGNTRLLKTAFGGDLVFERVGRQLNAHHLGSFGGWNSGNGRVAMTNSVEVSTVYHEIAHNWDEPNENSRIAAFRQISGWRNGWASGFTAARDGSSWHFHSTSSFARGYGRHNPFEDFATTWESYFDRRFHGGHSQVQYVAAKHAALNVFFAGLSV